MNQTTIVVSPNSYLIDCISRKLSSREVVSTGISNLHKVLQEYRDKVDMVVLDWQYKQGSDVEFGMLKNSLIHTLLSAFREIIPVLKEKKWSSITLILPKYKKSKEDLLYGTVNFYLYGFLKSLALELAKDQIIINLIETDENNINAITQTVKFLSEERAYITGQVIPLQNMDVEKIEGKKVALITGCGQGIGHAIATELGKAGYHLCVNDKDYNDGIKDLERRYNAYPVIADISQKNLVQKKIEKAIKEFGRIDVFVANAAYMKMECFESSSDATIDQHIAVNVEGHISCLEKVIPIMKKQGHGKIILFSSIFGIAGWENATAYAGTKSAMIGLAKHLSNLLKQYNISVTAIAPGVIDTPQLQADADDLGVTVEEVKNIYKETIPLRRLGKAEDISYLVRYLCDGGNDYLTGTCIQSNGGESR